MAMPYVQILLADGFEEIEAIAVIDILRRAGISVDILGVGNQTIVSARGITIIPDRGVEEAPLLSDMLILPGGEPGTSNLEKSPMVCHKITQHHHAKKWIAAICAAPRILDHLGILEGRVATSYPSTQADLKNCHYSESDVVISDHIITSRGAGTSLAFAYTLVTQLCHPGVSEKLQTAMVYSRSKLECPGS